MRAILVDDEQLPLLHLKKLLERDVGGMEVIGTYSNPIEAIEMAKSLLPDVVFLDINMPEMNGLEAGEQIQMSCPDTEIVFVTGFDQYAVDAFELSALDYVMKPVQLKRLQKTMQRLRGRITEEQKRETRQVLSIGCFNHIHIQVPDQEPTVIKWRTAKALELFAYLLHNRNRLVDKDTLIELLWPDSDVASVVSQLYTTIYLIRQTLKQNHLGELSICRVNLENGYKLETGSVRIDTEEWEAQVKQLGDLDADSVKEHERVLRMYQGDYFGDYHYLWAEHERERLRRMWFQLAKNISEYYIEQEMWQAAIEMNYHIQQLQPDDEYSYFQLMKLFDRIGDRAGVEEQYGTLTKRCEQELDTEANESITVWYEAWKRAAGECK